MNTPYAFVARLEAKPEKAEAVATLLAGAPRRLRERSSMLHS